MTPPSSVPAAEDGGNSRNVIVVSGRISPRALALCGLVLFALGFWSGRETRDSETVVIAQASAPASAPLATPLPSIAPAISAPAEQRSPSRVTTTIRLMKFAPEKIDLHVGDTIEW